MSLLKVNKRKLNELNPFENHEIVQKIATDQLYALLQSKGHTIEHIASNSWVCIIKQFLSPTGSEEFDSVWAEHPKEFQKIKMFGKEIDCPRFQQAYGKSYKFSGNISQSIEETPLINRMKDQLNSLISMENEVSTNLSAESDTEDHTQAVHNTPFQFNMCLCNWYEAHHYIGPHSDDTRQLRPQSPVAGLSWGCTRTFRLTPRENMKKTKGIKLKTIVVESGDLIIMGGACQDTHKHEILKLKSGEQKGNRICFTFRCFK